jgi:hypothetical protein
VPSNDATIGDMASVMHQARAAGLSLTPEQAAKEVRRRLDSYLGGALKGDPARVRELLGEDGAAKLRELEVKKLEEQPGRRINTSPADPNAPAPQRRGVKPPETMEEFREQRRQERIEEEQRRLRGQGR